MPTTVRAGRRTPHQKSDLLRQDEVLWQKSKALASWLAQRDIETVTSSAVLAFALTLDAGAVVERDAVWYEWVWDPVRELWCLVCHDRSTIVLPGTGADRVEFQVDIPAAC